MSSNKLKVAALQNEAQKAREKSKSPRERFLNDK